MRTGTIYNSLNWRFAATVLLSLCFCLLFSQMYLLSFQCAKKIKNISLVNMSNGREESSLMHFKPCRCPCNQSNAHVFTAACKVTPLTETCAQSIEAVWWGLERGRVRCTGPGCTSNIYRSLSKSNSAHVVLLFSCIILNSDLGRLIDMQQASVTVLSANMQHTHT